MRQQHPNYNLIALNKHIHHTCYTLPYSYDHPRHFLLSYITASNGRHKSSSQKVQKEYIGLTYTGYRFSM